MVQIKHARVARQLDAAVADEKAAMAEKEDLQWELREMTSTARRHTDTHSCMNNRLFK